MRAVAVAIRIDANGCIALALAALRKSPDEYCGYVMNAQEDALFRMTRDDRGIELRTTAGEREWSRAWRIPVAGDIEYRAIEPAIEIESADFAELEALAQDFVARWIWFRNGPHEETAIEAQRFASMGYAIGDANLRSAALARIRGNADGSGRIFYSELDAQSAWIEDALARCWPDPASS